MNVTTALLRVKRQFGDEFGVVITDDDIYGWMYEAESDIIRNTGCNDVRITVSSSAFPTETPSSVNIKRVSVANKALQYVTAAELDLLGLATNTTGGPEYWYQEITKICLFPIPTSVVIVEIYYNKVPDIMVGTPASNNFTVPEVYQDDVIKYCIARAHNKNNNLQAEAASMSLYDKTLVNRRDEAQSSDLILYKGADPMDFETADGIS